MTNEESMSDFQGFIGIHLGVGKHSFTNEQEYKQTCKTACKKAVDALRKGKSAMDAVAIALAELEDSPCTNAGYGSNLTEAGEVECDASLMDGKGMGFGAVGALKGFKNPSQVAHRILSEEIKGPSTLGLVPPLFLVGEGAAGWARDHGIPDVPPNELITERSLFSFKKHKAKLQASRAQKIKPQKRRKLEYLCVLDDSSLDTVGAVCVDSTGTVCAGSSSGGLLLKTPGRVGQAAVFGAGCWARNVSMETSVASSTTGCGEYLIKTLLARECAEGAITRDGFDAVTVALQEKFLDSSAIDSADQKLAGIILLKATKSRKGCREVEFVWGHTAHSMCVGYMSTLDSKPTARICRSNVSDSSHPRPVLIEGTMCMLGTGNDVT